MKNKKILSFIIFILFLNSCSIGNYEIVGKGQQEKIVEKLDKLTIKVNNLEEELKIFRKQNLQVFVENNIEKKVEEKLKILKQKELEAEAKDIKKVELQNKLLEKQNEQIDKDIAKKQNKIISGKYCILDTCMYEKGLEIEKFGKISEIMKNKNFYINLLGKDCKPGDLENKNSKCIIASKISESKSFLEKKLNFGNTKETIFINQFLNFFIKTNYSVKDKKIFILQEIFDKKGNKLNLKQAQEIFNSNFNLFDSKFKINSLEFKISPIIQNLAEENYKIFSLKNYTGSEELKKIILEDILKTKKIYKNYIFSIDKDKGIYISYSLKNKVPEKLVFLGNDKKYLEKILKDNFLIDKDLNNKILSYYKDYKILDLNDKEIKNFDSNIKKPIFKVEKFDNSGNYLLYFSKYYFKQKK